MTKNSVLAWCGKHTKEETLRKYRAHLEAGKRSLEYLSDKALCRDFPKLFGIPIQLANLANATIWGVSQNENNTLWGLRFLDAIEKGADLSGVVSQAMLWLLSDEEDGIINLAADDQAVLKIVNMAIDSWKGLPVNRQSIKPLLLLLYERSPDNFWVIRSAATALDATLINDPLYRDEDDKLGIVLRDTGLAAGAAASAWRAAALDKSRRDVKYANSVEGVFWGKLGEKLIELVEDAPKKIYVFGNVI